MSDDMTAPVPKAGRTLSALWQTQQEIDAMAPDTLKLYHSTGSPNSRRVRIFLVEKGLKVLLMAGCRGAGDEGRTGSNPNWTSDAPRIAVFRLESNITASPA